MWAWRAGCPAGSGQGRGGPRTPRSAAGRGPSGQGRPEGFQEQWATDKGREVWTLPLADLDRPLACVDARPPAHLPPSSPPTVRRRGASSRSRSHPRVPVYEAEGKCLISRLIAWVIGRRTQLSK